MLTLVLFTTGAAVSKEQKISETFTASCLLKITLDPAILPLNDTTIDYLLHSSGVGGKAARDIFEVSLSEEALKEAVKIEWLADEAGTVLSRPSGLENPMQETGPDNQMMMQMQNIYEGFSVPRVTGRRMSGEPSSIATEQMILLRLLINLRENDIGHPVKPAAEEFMNALIDNLKGALSRACDEYLNRLRGRLQLAEEEVARTEQELNEMQGRLRNIAGSRILDKNTILNEITDIRRSLQNLKLEQGSDDVIVESIAKRIAQTKAKMEDQIAKDEVAKEMQQIIERQIQQVATTKQLYEKGIAGEDKIAEAEQSLSRARIELAQRLEQLSKAAGGNLIESLNRELADRSTQAAQNQAKLTALTRQLAEAEELLNKADEHELLMLKADITKQNLQEAIVWRDRISRQMRLIQPPMVSVLGGE